MGVIDIVVGDEVVAVEVVHLAVCMGGQVVNAVHAVVDVVEDRGVEKVGGCLAIMSRGATSSRRSSTRRSSAVGRKIQV